MSRAAPKDKSFEELWAEAVKKIPRFPWDDPSKRDDERWTEYEKRFDRIILPPPYPDDPKEREYERIPGSFELPIRGYPGWRTGFVPKGALIKAPATNRPARDQWKKTRQ